MVLLCINASKTCLSEIIIGRRSDCLHEASGKNRHPVVQGVRVFESGLQVSVRRQLNFLIPFLRLCLSCIVLSLFVHLTTAKCSEKGAEEAIEAEKECLAPIGITRMIRIIRIIGILRLTEMVGMISKVKWKRNGQNRYG